MNEPATEKQIKYGRSLGISVEGMTKQELRLAIDRVLNGGLEAQKKQQQVYDDMDAPVITTPITPVKPYYPAQAKAKSNGNVEGTHLNCKIMCAKDLFIALLPLSVAEGSAPNNTMDQAIALVKQAKEAFE